MSETRGRPSSAVLILETARTMLDGGAALSLDSVARGAGLTKPGLMYHFPTKAAMVAALVDHVVDEHVEGINRRLGRPVDQATANERIRAYVEWAFDTPHRRSDLVMFSDPKLSLEMSERWNERVESWIAVPAGLPADERARLNAARFIADGVWFAIVSGSISMEEAKAPELMALALDLAPAR